MNPLLIGLLVSIGIGAIGMGVQTLRLSHRDVELANSKTEFADFKRDQVVAALTQRAETAERSAEQARAHQAESRQIEATGTTVKEKVVYVPVAANCTTDPGVLAIFDGIDRVLDDGESRPGPGVPGDRRDPARGMPAPNATGRPENLRR